MSLKAISVRINDSVPTIDSISYGNQINVKVGNQQDYKVKSIGIVGGGGVKELSKLKDVTLENLKQDDALLYNEANAKWENKKVNLDFGEY